MAYRNSRRRSSSRRSASPRRSTRRRYTGSARRSTARGRVSPTTIKLVIEQRDGSGNALLPTAATAVKTARKGKF